jgi:hypothetical protein
MESTLGGPWPVSLLRLDAIVQGDSVAGGIARLFQYHCVLFDHQGTPPEEDSDVRLKRAIKHLNRQLVSSAAHCVFVFVGRGRGLLPMRSTAQLVSCNQRGSGVRQVGVSMVLHLPPLL